MDVDWAYELAEKLLAEPLPRRWAHSRGVGATAGNLARIMGPDADLLHAAAILHDIASTPALAVPGSHPQEGAPCRGAGAHADDRLCRLVAHHSCALLEAEERGLRE